MALGGLVISSALETQVRCGRTGKISPCRCGHRTGVTIIDGDATFEFGSASSATVDMSQGDGTLKLVDSDVFTGGVEGLGAGDTILFGDIGAMRR